MQTLTTILETLDRSLRHPGWAYVNSWHHPPLLGLRLSRPAEVGEPGYAPGAPDPGRRA